MAAGMDEFGNPLPARGFFGGSPQFGYSAPSFPTMLPAGNYRPDHSVQTAQAPPTRSAPLNKRATRTRGRYMTKAQQRAAAIAAKSAETAKHESSKATEEKSR
jgi:hypothetical protein